MNGKPLGLYFETLEDPKGTLTLEDVQKIDAHAGLQKSQEEIPNYGLNASAQWVRFSLHNPLPQPQLIVLENKFTFVDRFTLYYRNTAGLWEFKEAGDQVPFSKRDIKTRQAAFRFLLTPGTHEFYARTQTVGAHQLPLAIWTQDEFFNHNFTEYGIIGVLVGFHLVICLYNLFLFFSLKDKTYLVYVAYVCCNLVYQGSGLGLFQQMFSEFNMFETLSNKVMIVSVDLVAISALLFSSLFLNIKKRLPTFFRIFQATALLDCINIMISLFFSVRLGTTLCIFNASLVTSILILSGFLISRRGYLPAVFYLVAWGCYLFGVTGTISNLIGLLPTSEFSRWGQFTGGAFEVAILSLALGARINQRRKQHVQKIQELNADLEDKVKQRTSEIQSLLLHIPQGILSINRGALIGHSYSAQLPDILGHSDIADQSFKALILDRSTLSDDAKDQAWQALSATVGESTLNYEINSDKFPLQLTYRYQTMEKVLRLTWNRELNENAEVDRILVTLLDVSAEVAAQDELTRRNHDFDVIRQLVDIGAKKSIQFFASGNPLIEENLYLSTSDQLNTDTIKILFVNTHTLKGAARSLQLKDLANEFHKIESYYASIVRSQVPIDQKRIVDDIQAVSTIYRSYEKANRDVLGRKDDLSKVAVDREFLQENVELLHHLAEVSELSGNLKEIVHQYRDELTQMIFMSLHSILTDIMSQAEKIAKDLGREPPVIHYDIDEILINYSQEMALKNSFVHLLRNALEHGIEPAGTRLENGKPAVGTLNLRAYRQESSIVIEFKDDGRGLALGKIRDKGAKMPLARQPSSPEELAALVFETGFSTTEKVSLISGRGVGMGAVRQFLAAEGGTITLVLGPVLDKQQELYEFSLRMTLPLMSSLHKKITDLDKLVS